MAERRLPRLLLVTGMSGAGKSTVLDALEDMGWDVVDNLPAERVCPTSVIELQLLPVQGQDTRGDGATGHARHAV